MKIRFIHFIPVFLCISLFSSFAFTADYSALEGRLYDPKIDPNPDMFISSWKENIAKNVYGSLIERPVFTQCTGDPLRPVVRGAVLTDFSRFSHGTLNSLTSTKPITLKGEQLIFYIYSGKGTLKYGNKTAELYDGIGVLVPPGVEFSMINKNDEALMMYIIGENVPAGAKTRKDILIRDENILPPTSSNVHWCHIYKNLFSKEDGLLTGIGMGPVWFDPMTMGQPHSHAEGVEEIWFALKGDINFLLGKQLRKLPEGYAFKIPPNGNTPHSTINLTGEPLKLFWFMKVPDKPNTTPAKDGSELDSNPYDPAKEPDIDMYISSWKDSMPQHVYGSLIERNIFTPCTGDPLKPTRKGAVLTDFKRFSHASLEATNSTKPSTLKDEQLFLYFDGGQGIIKAGKKTANLYKGMHVIIPPDIEFTMTNTGTEPLTMYLIVEPVPKGFKASKEMLVKDEQDMPIEAADAHWTHCYRSMFWRDTTPMPKFVGMGPVWFDPMTMGQPHSHEPRVEEIWFALKGDITILLGKQLRKLPVGSAFKIPPDGKNPHSTINATNEPIKLYWFMKVAEETK